MVCCVVYAVYKLLPLVSGIAVDAPSPLLSPIVSKSLSRKLRLREESQVKCENVMNP